MIQRPFAEIAGLGVAVPSRIVTNADFEATLDTTDQWIVERTGIRERHYAGPDDSVASLSRDAALQAMDRAGVTAADLDSIVLGTASPDRLLPSTACDLQALLGAERAAAFDISAACPGFLFALTVSEGLIASGQSDVSLVLGAEKLTSITDMTDRSTAILFGDAAGAAVIRRAPAARGHAGSSAPTSSPTAAWATCCTGRAAVPPIRSATRWSRRARSSCAWRAARSSSPPCSP